jgi:hypothetical protein
MNRRVTPTEILEACRPPMRRQPASLEDRLGDVEYALPAAMTLLSRVLCHMNGWNDDDQAGFIRAIADAVRLHQGPVPAPGVRDTPLLIHLDNMAAGLGGEFAR